LAPSCAATSAADSPSTSVRSSTSRRPADSAASAPASCRPSSCRLSLSSWLGASAAISSIAAEDGASRVRRRQLLTVYRVTVKSQGLASPSMPAAGSRR
jgi:hypothetical protein